MEKFVIDGQYGKLLKENGIDPQKVLKEAGLPIDTFAHRYLKLAEQEYFRMLDAVDKVAADPLLPIKLVKRNRLETFSPPILAAYCSENGIAFIKRLAHYKKLIGPVIYQLVVEESQVTIQLATTSGNQFMSPFFVTGELAFLVEMISRATGVQIIPREITTTFPVENDDQIAFFGLKPHQGVVNKITFNRPDLQRSFTSSNLSLLDYLEPELNKRLAELDVDSSYAKRVRSALVELLPRGMAGVDDAAHQLGVSRRTLQRKLKAEQTNFQQQLNETREMLAKNYLLNTTMSTDEIAFLLAYQETNSFQRAFSIWTGETIQEFHQKNR